MAPTRRLFAGLAPLMLLAACETTPPRPPRATALPPPAAGPSEPAPMPSDVTDDYIAARRAALTPAPVGADAMPGLGPSQRIGSDMTTAPIPADSVLRPR